MHNITSIKTTADTSAIGVSKSPKNVASKRAVNMYFATSNSHFPNSSHISFSLKDITNIQLFAISDKKNEEKLSFPSHKNDILATFPNIFRTFSWSLQIFLQKE